MRLGVMTGLVVGLFAGLAGSARADSDIVEPIGIRYKAPADCPDSFAFFREIASHTSRVRAARRGETARVLAVDVADSGAAFTGQRSFANPSSSRPASRFTRRRRSRSSDAAVCRCDFRDQKRGLSP
jgi:hypothetical protein